jgi:cytochrome oxidase Cu insertion factor (SCO1/SenC/PrrC family)
MATAGIDGLPLEVPGRGRWWWAAPRWARFGVVPFTLAVVVSMIAGSYVFAPRAVVAVAGDPLAQFMGISDLGGRPAPGFTLTDQNDRPLSLAALRGRAVLVAFIDARCSQICPVLAQEFRLADQALGSSAGRVALVGINVNPAAESPADLRSFDRLHGLDDLPNWHFLTGSTAQLETVWKWYGIDVTVSAGVDQTSHAAYLYFLDPDGGERYIAAPQVDQRADGTAYLPSADLARWGGGISVYLKRALAR